MTQQRFTMEHRALEDREPVAIGEHPPHVVEARQRERVVLRQLHDPVRNTKFPVHRIRIGHHVDPERVVRNVGRHARRR